MCGIAGWIGSVPGGEQVAACMMQRLHHRGPDDRGMRQWPEATLVHTRLSIIDRSAGGRQPMPNEDHTIWTVFNGEIYNHRALRRELEGRGHTFRGRSDTEVILHLYEEEGAAFVERLRGMFALAVYDSRRKKLLLARDRFGIKPLFYAPGRRRFAFASEINALRAVPDLDLTPDQQAVHDFAALLYVPAPATLYTGIRALQPAERMEVTFSGDELVWQTGLYHTWTVAPDPSLTMTRAVDRAEELISEAVERQLESEVPLGALLSGGIDSSLVSTCAQRSIPGDLHTFNVQFPDRTYDETWAAQAVAQHIGSNHRTLAMEHTEGTWTYVTGLLAHAGQPFADTSLFAVHAIARLMREHLTVVLSGDGGDEGFGGYNSYRRLAVIERLQQLPAACWQVGARLASPLARRGLVRNTLPQRIRDLMRADDTAIMQVNHAWLREEEHGQLCRPAEVLPVRRLFERQWDHRLPPNATRLERLSAHAAEVDLRLRLPNDYLFKVDTASMRHSVEVRVPMLDEELVALGLTLPHRLKVDGAQCKIVLRKVAARLLPSAVAEKPKHGFGVPVDTWVDAHFKSRLRDLLYDDGAHLEEYFRPEAYKPWVEAFCREKTCPGISRQGLYQRVIMLLSLHLALSSVSSHALPA